jgi:hypothetical protein
MRSLGLGCAARLPFISIDRISIRLHYLRPWGKTVVWRGVWPRGECHRVVTASGFAPALSETARERPISVGSFRGWNLLSSFTVVFPGFSLVRWCRR